jgi:sugar-specific transcriptional regulator TrmB
VELVSSLLAVGFTEYEAKVYLELLRESPATGYQLSKKAGVPRSMVYEALGRLHARGAVMEVHEDRATLYRPLPPDVLLDRHEQEQLQLLQGLREGLNQLYTVREEEHLWSISGHKTVLSYAVQMIREATTELSFVLADPELETLRKEILQANEKGLKINALLTGAGELDCGEVAWHPPLESALQNLTAMFIVIADSREALIATTSLETTATITRNHNLVFIAGQFVWMELFTQRIYARLGDDLLARLTPEDRRIFESLPKHGRGA